ncbi:MAG: hypothetical protein FJX75_24120, partial [Armatimonadetes bacterium]|nr:hypothetical protein [Armatimonadota bacterium]
MPPCPLLADLAQQALALWPSPEQERRRTLWADHFHGRTREVPVSCAMFQGWQDLVWQQIIPEETFAHKEGLARAIEMHLRHRLWRAAHLTDDTPLDPTLMLGALPALEPDELWGVPLAFESTGLAGGAYKPIPPLQDPADIAKLRQPSFRVDEAAIARQTEEVHDLIGEALPLVFRVDALHNGPFEWAVRLRGMDNLLLDVYDRPEWLKELMAFLQAAIVQYHREREAAGFVHAPTERALHSPWDDCPAGDEGRLSAGWGYLHAQSAASYGPATYAEFVQPYNLDIARLFGKVYYHGCEDLTQKVSIIRDLPNLREFHVSPWSQVAPIAGALPEHVVMEVHSHPTNPKFRPPKPGEVPRNGGFRVIGGVVVLGTSGSDSKE